MSKLGLQAPEPPTHRLVAGWQVHYPFDGELNENGLVAQLPLDVADKQPPPVEQGGLAVFTSSDAGYSWLGLPSVYLQCTSPKKNPQPLPTLHRTPLEPTLQYG